MKVDTTKIPSILIQFAEYYMAIKSITNYLHQHYQKIFNFVKYQIGNTIIDMMKFVLHCKYNVKLSPLNYNKWKNLNF